MTKLELVQRLVEANRQLYRRDIEAIVAVFFEQIAAAALRRGFILQSCLRVMMKVCKAW